MMDSLPTFGMGFLSGGFVVFVFLAILRPWFYAIASGARIPAAHVIGMRLRREPVDLILDAHVALEKRGEGVDLSVVEAAYLAHRSNVKNEQDLVSFVQETVASGEVGMDLTARVGNQPNLKTSRLSLTPFVAGDAAAVLAYASNPNVSRDTTWNTHSCLADAERFIRWVQGRKGDFCWAIRPIPSDVAKGAIELGLEDTTNGAVHYVLAEDLWNRGFMTEAVEAVLGWAYSTIDGLERVATGALSVNHGSRRVLEKCGFVFDGLVQENWDKFDDPVELATYSLTRNRWQNLRADVG